MLDLLWSQGKSFGAFFMNLLRINLGFLLIFWLMRACVLSAAETPEHHLSRVRMGDDGDGDAPVHAWADALYHSIMTQSTVGSADLVPTSGAMRLITGMQSLSILVGLGIMGALQMHQTAAAHAAGGKK